MRRIDGPAIHIAPDDMPALLLALDERVVICLADAFRVLQIEEQSLVTSVRGLVIDDGRARVVSIVRHQQAAAALAGVEVAGERLKPDAVRAVPALVAVEVLVLLTSRAVTWWLEGHGMEMLLCRKAEGPPMKWWQRICQWRDERYELIQLRHEMERIDRDAEPIIKAARSASKEAWERAWQERYEDMRFCFLRIDKIETNRRLRAAHRYGVPVPEKPPMYEENEYWEWDLGFGDHFLTIKGHAHLRREIACEKEISWRPWLSWGGFLMGLAGLIIAALVALFK